MPTIESKEPDRKCFKALPISTFHIGIAKIHTEAGKLNLLVTIDRISKLAFAQLHEKTTRQVAADFLHALVEAASTRTHFLLTNNSLKFAYTGPKKYIGEDYPTSSIGLSSSRAPDAPTPSAMPARSTALSTG